MAKLGKKYFTKGKVMVAVVAEGNTRPLIPFDPHVDEVFSMDLVKKCEGIQQRQADQLFDEIQAYFLNKPAIAWTELNCFVDLANTKKFKILKEPSACL